jgi:excisionase family DNA binding protein
MTRAASLGPLTLDELRQRTTITVAELAGVFGCGLNQAYAAVRDGTIPSVRCGSSIRIPVPGLLRVLGDQAPDPSDGR